MGSAEVRVQELLNGLPRYLSASTRFSSIQPLRPPSHSSSASPISLFTPSSWAPLLPTLCGSPELDSWELSIDGGEGNHPRIKGHYSAQTQQPTEWSPAPLVIELETYRLLRRWSALPGAQQLRRTERCDWRTRAGQAWGKHWLWGRGVVINRDDERKQLKWHGVLRPWNQDPALFAQRLRNEGKAFGILPLISLDQSAQGLPFA